MSEELFRKAKCCSCEKPMKKSKYLNLIQLNHFANWQYPVFGNVLDKDPNLQNRAGAIICDDCFDQKPKIKYALEFKDGTIIYHPIDELTPVEDKSKQITE